MRKISFLMAAVALIFLGTNSHALTISDAVFGSQQPGTATWPNTVTNGDFTITGNSIATLVGNGVDESTTWTFDLTTDPDYALFLPDLQLVSAMLTLELTPKNALITTDWVGIQGLPSITAPIQSLPVYELSTVEIDLLDYYTTDQVWGALTGGAGTIAMQYSDDAILSYSKLELHATPEPGTIVLLLAGLAGLVGLKKKYS